MGERVEGVIFTSSYCSSAFHISTKLSENAVED